ncbi:hypothetical protein [Streptomyces cadmiisoli]|uniref:hypothetical protein n=1 Tax=Streptomyces cadmiisoli TaxID=2184053 RepID=UPI0013A70AEB|nr:hypothetical protein [Streptomyces cadmiisoli]
MARIKAIPEIANYHVTWSIPKQTEKKWVMVGKVDWMSSAWKTNRQVETDYSVHFVITVDIPAATAEDVETAALEVAEHCRKAVESEPSLGGVVISSVMAPERLVSWPTPEGFEAQWEGAFEIKARENR